MRINLGASQTKLDGFVNIDVVSGCDLQLDLDTQPFPFESDSVECVFSFHTIEHLDNYLFALGEIWRVLKHGGRFLLSVPYVTLTEYNLVNPFHKQNFNEFSFDFFEIGKLKNSAGESTPILFTKGWHRFQYMPEFVGMPEPQLTYARRHFFNVVKAIDFGLYAVKPPHRSISIEPSAGAELKAEFDTLCAARAPAPWALSI